MDRVLRVRPELFAIERARDRLSIEPFELLHAGPPLEDPRRPCAPLRNAAIAAILYEGWADDEDAARVLLESGRLALRPAQDAGCVVPLADVVSPSMWLQIVRDANGVGLEACSPINGGMAHPLRVGVLSRSVVDHLHWLDRVFGPAYLQALTDTARGATVRTGTARAIDAPSESIPLIEVADHGLAEGDDCHGNTAMSTKQLARQLHTLIQGEHAEACRSYLAQSPGFFLNLWMAASRCLLSSVVGTEKSTMVTAAGGNGQTFGIQLAGRPGHWFTTPANPPRIAQASAELAAQSLGAIGDSAIVDILGFGAMTTLDSAIDRPPAFSALWPEDEVMPRELLAVHHPGFARTRPKVILDARKISDACKTSDDDISPVISLGVLDRDGVQGRIGTGFYRPGHQLFDVAAKAALGKLLG